MNPFFSSLLQYEPDVTEQEELALDIAIPQVFEQPPLTALSRDKFPHIEAMVARLYRQHCDNLSGPLGTDYQAVVDEFQPLLTWALSCWDFLLTTEGCRFLTRHGPRCSGIRGDYRAFTEKDYTRLVYKAFRECILEFAQQPEAPSLEGWMRRHLWAQVLHLYQQLRQPLDARQRVLTAYSYLRCVPYRFLNDYHQDIVTAATQRLPNKTRKAIDAYFFHFYTETASAALLGCSEEDFWRLLTEGLEAILRQNRLVYCLLRQIARY